MWAQNKIQNCQPDFGITRGTLCTFRALFSICTEERASFKSQNNLLRSIYIFVPLFTLYFVTSIFLRTKV